MELDEDGNPEPNYKLLKCCGTMRPGKRQFKVTVTPTMVGEEGFVTVHDYLKVVHPWLMGLKSETRTFKELLYLDPVGEGEELVVTLTDVSSLYIYTKRELGFFYTGSIEISVA